MKSNKEVLSLAAARRAKRGATLPFSQGSAVVKMNATIALCKLYLDASCQIFHEEEFRFRFRTMRHTVS